MTNRKEKYLAMSGSWVISDTDNLLWDTNSDLEYVPFPSIASAVRYIQNIEGSPKKSLNTLKVSDIHHIYQCRNSEGNRCEYYLHRICEENLESLLQHHSDF